jgi:hypothetical protein
MRRLIMLLVALGGAAAAARLVMKRRSGGDEPSPANVMPRPTPPEEDRMPDREPEPEPASAPADTPGPIDEGEAGAITAAPVPEEPTPEAPPAPDDAELERAVETEIAEDPAVPEEAVEVDVEGGIAQLRGSVPDEETALRVGDDAARIDGVIGLDDQLERPGNAESPDEPEAAKRDPEQSGSESG